MSASVSSRSFSTRGSGAPDYEKIMHRGAVAQRIILKADETLVLMGLLCDATASPYPHAGAPLAVGETRSAIDLATGLDVYAIPIGFSSDIYFYWWSFDRAIKGCQLVDGFLFSTLHEAGHVSHYENEIGPAGIPVDPTGITAHTLGYTAENRGDDVNAGYYMTIHKLFPVSTPPLPEVKTIRCKYCGSETIVDRKTTEHACSECGLTTLYFPRVHGSDLGALHEEAES